MAKILVEGQAAHPLLRGEGVGGGRPMSCCKFSRDAMALLPGLFRDSDVVNAVKSNERPTCPLLSARDDSNEKWSRLKMHGGAIMMPPHHEVDPQPHTTTSRHIMWEPSGSPSSKKCDAGRIRNS